VAFAAANYALLLWIQGAEGGGERWGVTMGTVVVAGLAMDYMRGRLEAMVERLRDAVDRLSDAARTDPLTELVNRRGFTELLDVELERASRSGQPLSLVTADLDGFRAVNKRLGHLAGDDVLERTARVFERTRRRIDALARIGGEEFAVLLPDTREREAFVLAERLRVAVEREFEGEAIPLTMSLGVASAPKDAHQSDRLMGAADQSRHAAKRLGRNRTVIFSAEVMKVLDRQPSTTTQSTEAQLAPLFKLAEALDLRDAGTAEHSQAVGQYAQMMARELGLDASSVERIRLAGVLHDVGKIGVSDAILRKPSALTEEEWLEMCRHPEIGARLIGDDAPDIRDWVLAHHERPDGKGYPKGLRGTGIPLEARILAVADAFEAMTADRVYRPARPRAEALAELERHSGTQFDPMVVAAFLTAVDAGTVKLVPTGDPA
jgi:diguanylate cyclase (GGDEF)-like protein